MSTETNNASTKAKRNAGIAALVLLALGGTAWWFLGRDSAPAAIARSKEEAEATGKPFVTINGRPATGEELKNIAINPMRAGPSAMSDMIRKYAEASPEEKKKMLDEQIDAQERVKTEMGESGKGPPSTQPRTDGPGPDGTQRVLIRRGGGGEKGALENLPPDIRAAMQQYKADMDKRRAERGLPPQRGVMIIRRDLQMK